MAESNLQNRRLGYARVSTYGQTLGVQLDQLRAAGCTQIYREKVTGARRDRRELLRLPSGHWPRRRGDCDAQRPLGALDLRPFAIVKQIVDAEA